MTISRWRFSTMVRHRKSIKYRTPPFITFMKMRGHHSWVLKKLINKGFLITPSYKKLLLFIRELPFIVPFIDYSFMNGMNGMNGRFYIRKRNE